MYIGHDRDPCKTAKRFGSRLMLAQGTIDGVQIPQGTGHLGGAQADPMSVLKVQIYGGVMFTKDAGVPY